MKTVKISPHNRKLLEKTGVSVALEGITLGNGQTEWLASCRISRKYTSYAFNLLLGRSTVSARVNEALVAELVKTARAFDINTYAENIVREEVSAAVREAGENESDDDVLRGELEYYLEDGNTIKEAFKDVIRAFDPPSEEQEKLVADAQRRLIEDVTRSCADGRLSFADRVAYVIRLTEDFKATYTA